MPIHEMLSPEPGGAPVFVDATGRRARRIERIAGVVVLACVGYGLTLLIAALSGVPIQGAVVPYPDLGATTHAARGPVGQTQPVIPGAVTPTLGTSSSAPSAKATATAAATSTAAATRHTTRAVRTTPTHATPHSKATTPSTPSTPSTHGNPSAPGITHRATGKPTAAHTGHGRVLHP